MRDKFEKLIDCIVDFIKVDNLIINESVFTVLKKIKFN